MDVSESTINIFLFQTTVKKLGFAVPDLERSNLCKVDCDMKFSALLRVFVKKLDFGELLVVMVTITISGQKVLQHTSL